MKTVAAEEVCGVVNKTTDMCVEFQVGLSEAVTEATTWSVASISNSSIFGTGQFYMAACQLPYHIKNQRFLSELPN